MNVKRLNTILDFSVSETEAGQPLLPETYSADVLAQVASAISHDVRTPVRHIQHFLDFFEASLTEPLSDESREHLKVVRGAVAETREMLDELLRFSRLHNACLAPVRFDLSHLIKEAVSRVEQILRFEGVELHLSGNADLIGHRDYILQMFVYLFENAVLHRPAEEHPVIHVQISEEAGNVVILLGDEGKKIKGESALAFRLFQKMSLDAPSKGQGTGLSFARTIARMHGGEIQIAQADIMPVKGLVLKLVFPN